MTYLSDACDLLTLCSPTLFLMTCVGVRESQSQLVTSQISDLKALNKSIPISLWAVVRLAYLLVNFLPIYINFPNLETQEKI